MEKHSINILPNAPRFRALLGPSFILLGLGLGSGEFILWPYLTSNFGMGIIWGAVLGVTFQFFINMEIERYALAKGESIFVGFARKYKNLPYWFIFSTLLAWIWPGIIATSARLFGEVFAIQNINVFGIILLLVIGSILTLGPVLYKTVEKISLVLITVSVPAIFVLAVYLSSRSDIIDMFYGMVNFGNIPKGLPLASFLAAFAFAGAGGNLNLAQSFYVKEKGYGMGKYGGKITSILTGEVEDISITGTAFAVNSENIDRFKKWWKVVNLEHFLVFWLGGVVSICMLSLLSYSTVFGSVNLPSGVEFIIYEAGVISSRLGSVIGISFLLIGGFMLFNTQLTVLDATSRIMAENMLILKIKRWKSIMLPKIYYSFLWLQILAGIIIFLFDFGQPFLLLTISAVLNAVAMFVHIGLTLNLNLTSLEKEIRPNLFRILWMVVAFLFFGYFSYKTIVPLFF
ncbi:MAG: Nramp family divalent metal transporter [bacterium]|nr:MAG: Nramp family divalent metal transporter [bacterium]